MTPPTELAVLMDGEHAGLLRRNRSGRLTLEYDADYEAKTGSTPLSLSMPLRGGHRHSIDKIRFSISGSPRFRSE